MIKPPVHHLLMAPLGTIEWLHCDPNRRTWAIGTYNRRKVTCEKCLALMRGEAIDVKPQEAKKS